MAEDETPSIPKRLVLLIVAGALIPFLAVGFTLYMTLGKGNKPSFEVVHDYLHTPQVIPERIEQAGDELRRIEIGTGNIEVYDASGQRYSIHPDGSMLRRGGAIPVPPQSFSIDDVDFDQLPAILSAVNQQTGADPSKAKLEYVGDELLWTITYWSEAGSGQLYFTPNGEPRRASNAR